MAATLIPADSELHKALSACERSARCLVLAGLPGIGKSLLTRQLALIAQSKGRATTVMQWDTVRESFEAHPAGEQFPPTAGVAHPVIRLAADRWARTGVGRWHATAPSDGLLIIEAPLVGGRMMALARPADDDAEPLLAHEAAFLLPVPTAAVKSALRGRRGNDEAQSANLPFASVDVLDELVREINAVFVALGGSTVPAAGYDPDIYAAVYGHAMRARQCQRLEIDRVFAISAVAEKPAEELMPTDDEVTAAVAAAADLDDRIAESLLLRWYQ